MLNDEVITNPVCKRDQNSRGHARTALSYQDSGGIQRITSLSGNPTPREVMESIMYYRKTVQRQEQQGDYYVQS